MMIIIEIIGKCYRGSTSDDILNFNTEYVRNTTIHKDMKVSFVTQTLRTTYLRHHTKLILRSNPLISNIPQQMAPDRQHRRLKRKCHTYILTLH
jgi:hypothetical protein